VADTLPPFRDRMSRNIPGRAWGTARFHQLHPSQPVHGYTCAHVFHARICTDGDCEQIRQRPDGDTALDGADRTARGGWPSARGQLQAMDETAAHRDGRSASWSKTVRTARSRTSGENLLVVLLISAPLSHELEPTVFARGSSPPAFSFPFLLIGLNAAIYDAI